MRRNATRRDVVRLAVLALGKASTVGAVAPMALAAPGPAPPTTSATTPPETPSATAARAAASPGPSSSRAALDSLLGRRRMVRRFTSAPVDDAVVHRLIATATRAPSAGHRQPWAFVVVRDPPRRRALAAAAVGQMFVAEAPVVIVPCADPDRARERYGERAERYALIDASFASLLLLLAVVAEGLGACFVGAFDDTEVARLLALPPSVKPLAVIPVGHPAETPPPMARRPLTEVVHLERW